MSYQGVWYGSLARVSFLTAMRKANIHSLQPERLVQLSDNSSLHPVSISNKTSYGEIS